MTARLAHLLVRHARETRRRVETAAGDGWRVKRHGSGVEQCGFFVILHQKLSFSFDSRVNWREWVGATPYHRTVTSREVANGDLKISQGVALSKERKEGREEQGKALFLCEVPH